MKSRHVTLTGLWEKQTQRGTILSCRMTEVTKIKLIQALNDLVPGSELIVFPKDDRTKQTSPSHDLVLSIPVE